MEIFAHFPNLVIDGVLMLSAAASTVAACGLRSNSEAGGDCRANGTVSRGGRRAVETRAEGTAGNAKLDYIALVIAANRLRLGE